MLFMHLLLAGYLQEGQNPVVLKRGTERHELKHQEKASIRVGDVLEFLPGKHAFKLMEGSNQNTQTKVEAEQQQLLVKRKRQELDDESLARALQVSLTFGESNV